MEKSENAIEVRNIKKAFKVYYDKGNQLKERLLFRNRNKYEKREVLKGISFEVKKGEAIGLIGKNGCGKSTTLKLLTRIIYPDEGSIEIKGRVSSLIELGAGFHPDMTGRENIYTNAAIFGLNHKEIDRRLDDIIHFSELEEFIDNPVRTYSSGMYMRLAFSVAINVDADVLLIDEILAVGDVNFQQKCFEKLKEIKAKGTTIVIVSHSLSQIEQICERSIWIENGKIKESGVPKYVHEKYLASMQQDRMERIENESAMREKEKEQKKEQQEQEKREQEQEKERQEQKKDETIMQLPDFCEDNAVRMGNQKVEFVNVRVLNEQGEEKRTFYSGDKIVIEFTYKNNEKDLKGNFGIGIYRDDGLYCYGTNADIEFDRLIQLNKEGIIRIELPNVCLLNGKYVLNVAIHSKDSLEIYDDIRNIISFQIFSRHRDDGVCRLETLWYEDGKLIERGQ